MNREVKDGIKPAHRKHFAAFEVTGYRALPDEFGGGAIGKIMRPERPMQIDHLQVVRTNEFVFVAAAEGARNVGGVKVAGIVIFADQKLSGTASVLRADQQVKVIELAEREVPTELERKDWSFEGKGWDAGFIEQRGQANQFASEFEIAE